MYRFLVLLLLFNFALGHFHHDFDSDEYGDDSGPGRHHYGPGPHHGPGNHHGPGHHHGPGPFFGPGPEPGPGPFFGPGPFHGPGPDPFFGPGPFHGPGPYPGPGPFFGPGPFHGPGPDHGPGHNGGPRWGHPWHGPPQESDFDKLARYVISADKEVIKSCKQSPYSRVRVLPGADLYSLKYNLPEFTESGIKVQIKHRVISTTAEAQGVASFKDLRIIPDIVNAAGASWFFDNTTLTVLMPYKNPLQTEVALNCTGVVNESVIDVSKTTNSNDDLRSLDDNA